MTTVKAWNIFSKVEASVVTPRSHAEVELQVNKNDNLVTFGNGRSYGDCGLSDTILKTKALGLLQRFDENLGLLTTQSGVLLQDIIQVFVPKGWFLEITPGTKLITIGGAIASDVHGKNHHIAGCFSECVTQFEIMLHDGTLEICSPESNPELFRATCGGQGLTGVILSATIKLKKINSKLIEQTVYKTSNLKETFKVFENNADSTYSVAWLDCLSSGKNLGRAHVSIGEFADDGVLDYEPGKLKNLPIHLPKFALNSFTVKLFNFAYYHRRRKKITHEKVGLDSFFYPLDSISNWNKAYGKDGFVQYQFILPLETSFAGLEQILAAIAQSGKGSFLAVLKLYGDHNKNYLSFPMKGYSLALDFKIEDDLFDLLNSLDEIVVQHQGRIYLAKDARVAKEIFEVGYPQIEKFRAFRDSSKSNQRFNSLQSKRLGL